MYKYFLVFSLLIFTAGCQQIPSLSQNPLEQASSQSEETAIETPFLQNLQVEKHTGLSLDQVIDHHGIKKLYGDDVPLDWVLESTYFCGGKNPECKKGITGYKVESDHLSLWYFPHHFSQTTIKADGDVLVISDPDDSWKHDKSRDIEYRLTRNKIETWANFEQMLQKEFWNTEKYCLMPIEPHYRVSSRRPYTDHSAEWVILSKKEHYAEEMIYTGNNYYQRVPYFQSELNKALKENHLTGYFVGKSWNDLIPCEIRNNRHLVFYNGGAYYYELKWKGVENWDTYGLLSPIIMDIK